MLSVWICSVYNPASLYSRQAYLSWKKKVKLSLEKWFDNCFVCRQYYGAQCSNNHYQNCSTLIVTKSFTATSKHPFWLLKHNLRQAQSSFFLQKRFSSTSSKYKPAKLKKSFFVALIPEKLMKKLSKHFNFRQTKQILQYAHPTSNNNVPDQNLFDFPNFFAKPDVSNDNSSVSLPKSAIVDPKRKIQSAVKEKIREKSDINEVNSVPQSEFAEDNDVNTAVQQSRQDDDSKIDDDDLNDESSAITKRSQYEHLLTSIASKDSSDLIGEKSIFSSLKSYVEIPVNSFFSLISRTGSNSVEKSANGVEKLEESHLCDEKLSNDTLQDSKPISPPLSLLEVLYQYIPYVSNEVSKEHTEAMKKKETIRLKVIMLLLLHA